MTIGPINPNAAALQRIDARDGAAVRNSETTRGATDQGEGEAAGVQLDVANQLDLGKLADVAGPGPATIADPGEARNAARALALDAQQQLGGQSLSIANRSPERLAALVR
jgi:flagellin